MEEEPENPLADFRKILRGRGERNEEVRAQNRFEFPSSRIVAPIRVPCWHFEPQKEEEPENPLADFRKILRGGYEGKKKRKIRLRMR